MALKSLNFIAAVAVVGFLVTGCASTAHIEKDNTADFSKYKTYSWVSKEKESDKTVQAKNDLAEQNMREAVNRQLQKNGWSEVTNNPDLLVSADVLVEKNVREEKEAVYSQPQNRTYYNPYTRRYNTYYVPSQFLGYEAYTRPIREGTVTVTLIDRKKDKAVWQGSTTEELNKKNITGKEIDQTVKTIFKKFDTEK